MKKVIVAAGTYALAAGIMYGQVNMILQHARKLNDQNNARQNAMMGESPQAAQQAPAPPPDPAQAAIDKLAADFATLQTDSSPAAKRQLARDISAAVQQAPKPSEITAGKLASDLATALYGLDLAPATLAHLAQCVNALVNNMGMNTMDNPTVAAYLETILKAGGSAHSQVAVVSSDFKIVVTDEQMAVSK